MNPTNRRLRLLGALQSRAEWPGDLLAERLGVSPRTLRRDVSHLRDLGYAIDSTAGSDGGYRLSNGRALPPLMLDDDEAVAVAVGLRAAVLSGVEGLDDAVTGALAKLETTLPSRLRSRVMALGTDTVHLIAHRPGSAVDPEVLATVALACRRGERLRIGYRDRAGSQTRRDVDPYRLVRTETHWYLAARDVTKDAWRTLRLDRIAEPQPLGTRVRLTDPPDPATLVAEAITFGPHERRVVVRLELPVERARRLVPTALDVRPADRHDAALVELGGDAPWWTARYLVSLGCRFDVVEGDELVDELHRLGRELMERHASGQR